jgi:predicted nucleotidyltransferase
MNPTPYPDLNGVLEAMTAGIRDALGDELVAVYLQGSFAVGGFDEHSDVDFVVAVRDDLPEPLVDALQLVHAQTYDLDCEWAKHLEGSYFPLEVLRSCERRAELLWYLEHGGRSLARSDHCNTAVVRATVRQHGVVLVGPEPSELVDPVAVETLRQEIAETMYEWGEEILNEPDRFRNRFYQSFIVLSYCRMLHDLQTGEVGSKRSGAEWAKRVLDPSWTDLIDGTWDGRPDPASKVREEPDPTAFARTLEFVRYAIDMREEIRSGGQTRPS